MDNTTLTNDAKLLMMTIFNRFKCPFDCIKNEKDIQKLCPTCLIKYHSQRLYALLCESIIE